MTSTAAKPKRKTKKRKGPSQAELKRQLAALKEENERLQMTNAQMGEEADTLQEEVAALSPLGERWDQALGEIESGEPLYFLDGDEDDAAGHIAKIDQEDGTFLYQAVVGGKVAYFGELEDASIQAERWADGTNTQTRAEPVSIRKTFETDEQQIGQDNPRRLKSVGPASEALEEAHFDVVDRPVNKDKLDMIAFMEEELVVRVADTTDPTMMPIPCVINDGVRQYFIRGQEQTVKRKFVEVLARCKITKFTQQLEKDGNGNDTYVNYPHTVLMCDFSVLHDPNPKGPAWLKNLLQEQQ